MQLCTASGHDGRGLKACVSFQAVGGRAAAWLHHRDGKTVSYSYLGTLNQVDGAEHVQHPAVLLPIRQGSKSRFGQQG